MKVIDGVQPAPAGVRVFVRGMPEGAQAKYAIGGRTEVLSTASVCDADAREGVVKDIEGLFSTML